MKERFSDVTTQNTKNIDVRILSHKDFVPLGEEIVQEKKRDKKKQIIMLSTLGTLTIVLFFFVSHVFSKANIFIEKNTIPFEFSNNVVVANQSTESNLPFTVVEVTDTYHESVAPDVLNASAQKAKGAVVVYNSYTKSKINLKKGSVFIAANNIRFISDTAVTVPGYTIDANKQIIPGQVMVQITAEKTGSASNIGNADLVLANYQKQKAKIFAKTTEVIAGGSDQMAYGLSENLKKTMSESIDADLKKSLFIRAEAEIPDEYILYPDMMIYTPKNLVVAGTPQTLDVSKEASLVAYVLKKKDIEKLIQNELKISEPIKPQYMGIDELSVKLVSKPENVLNPESLTLNFTGSGKIVSYIDTTDVAKSLSGVSKNKAQKILSEVTGLTNYTISINPKYIWFMPRNSNRIKIIDVNNK